MILRMHRARRARKVKCEKEEERVHERKCECARERNKDGRDDE